jgi:hypothetical protein
MYGRRGLEGKTFNYSGFVKSPDKTVLIFY